MSVPPATEQPPPRVHPAVYVAIAVLVLGGTALFATAAIAQARRPEHAPPARILGVAAWQLATAGFVSTLAGGLWLRRLV